MNGEEGEIHIDWSEPVSLEDAVSGVLGKAFGLYQYIGTHDVYGTDTLLYIGKAADYAVRTRLKAHAHASWSSTPVLISVGQIACKNPQSVDDGEWARKIELGEKLLIYTHSPAWNSSNVKSLDLTSAPELHVFNWGHRCRLLPEVSSRRWSGYGNSLPSDMSLLEE